MRHFRSRDEAEAFLERAREQLLLKHARQDRMRALRPLARRLKRDGHVASASTLEIVARGGDTTRGRLVGVIDALLPRCGTFPKAESAAIMEFLRLIDEATLSTPPPAVAARRGYERGREALLAPRTTA